MDPNLVIDALIFAIFSIMKQQGLSVEQAKAKFQAKVNEIEATPDLPMGKET